MHVKIRWPGFRVSLDTRVKDIEEAQYAHNTEAVMLISFIRAQVAKYGGRMLIVGERVAG